MRTTVTIDDDVLAVARSLAEQQGISLGSAISQLARRGFRTARKSSRPGVFDVPSDAPKITSEDVYRALSDFP